MEEATVVFQVDFSDENIKRKAMEAVSDFPGVTSVEYNRFDQLEVKGEFKIREMVEKLKEIDIYVSVLKPKQFDAGSSSGPKTPEQSEYSMPAAQPPNKGAWWSIPPLPQFTLNKGAWSLPQLPQFTLNKGAWSLPPLPQFKQLGQGGGLLAGFGIKKQQPPFKHPRQDYAEKLRNDEKAKAEEKARNDKAKAGGNMTGMQTAGTWVKTQVTGAIGSTLGTANTAHSQQTGGLGSTQPTSTANPYPTQQTKATNKHPKK